MITEPLVRVLRGGVQESEHRGAIAVVDPNGRLLSSVGDAESLTFLRSSAKPFQLLPLLESGAADRFGLSDAELAVIAGSHAGERRHTEAVQSILSKAGLSEEKLQCGAHPPFSAETMNELRAAGRAPSALHNNCSGKHAGMLLLASHLGCSLDDYLDPAHDVQKKILSAIADVAGLFSKNIRVGGDGCSAPTFALPLKNIARLFAVLAAVAVDEKPSGAIASAPTMRRDAGEGPTLLRRTALRRIVSAMMAYPEMVAGTERLDTDVMTVGGKRIVSKGGAEGVQCAGVIETVVRMKSVMPPLGIALKIADGDGRRGAGAAMIEALSQVGALERFDLERLTAHRAGPIKNHRGTVVGETKTDFLLRWVV